jgi:HEAT repeats
MPVRQLVLFGTVSLLVFLLEGLLVLHLLQIFWWFEQHLWSALLLGLVGSSLALLFLLGFQVHLHWFRQYQQLSDTALEVWTEHWLNTIWEQGSTPQFSVAKIRQTPAATETLLRLRERLRGADSYRAAQCYAEAGLLAKDLHSIWKDPKDLKLQALSRVARVRHPHSLATLEWLYQNPDPEVRRLTVLAMARVCSRLKLPKQCLVWRFYKKLSDPELSRGSIERALVLLEGNAEPVLEALLEPALTPQPCLSAALEALGHVRAHSLSDLAVYWLDSRDLSVRCAAARCLYRLGRVPPQAQAKLRKMLQESHFAARAQAVLALSHLKTSQIDQVLLRHLADPAWWVRHNSAMGLAHRGNSGLQALQRASVQHSDAFARDMARQQLIEIGAGRADSVLG